MYFALRLVFIIGVYSLYTVLNFKEAIFLKHVVHFIIFAPSLTRLYVSPLFPVSGVSWDVCECVYVCVFLNNLKMQIKTMLRSYLIPVRMATMKK